MKLRIAEPWEHRPLRCSAKRRPRFGIIRCEQMALHEHAHSAHVGGRWYLW